LRNGQRVLADVDSAARQNVAFRNVWLGAEVPALVRQRLGELGAHILANG
jgi:hypothetical protein